MVELVGLVLERPGPSVGLGLASCGLLQAPGDSALAPIHRLEHRPIEEPPEQRHEDEKVDDLRADRQPVDLHG